MYFEYKNATVDDATLEIKLAETFQGKGRSANLVKGHPIGALSLPLKGLIAAQKEYNQAVVDELMPEASVLRKYHPMVNSAGCVRFRITCPAPCTQFLMSAFGGGRSSPEAQNTSLSRPGNCGAGQRHFSCYQRRMFLLLGGQRLRLLQQQDRDLCVYCCPMSPFARDAPVRHTGAQVLGSCGAAPHACSWGRWDRVGGSEPGGCKGPALVEWALQTHWWVGG